MYRQQAGVPHPLGTLLVCSVFPDEEKGKSYLDASLVPKAVARVCNVARFSRENQPGNRGAQPYLRVDDLGPCGDTLCISYEKQDF